MIEKYFYYPNSIRKIDIYGCTVDDGFLRMLALGISIDGGKGISSASLPPIPLRIPKPPSPSPMEGKGISSTFIRNRNKR